MKRPAGVPQTPRTKPARAPDRAAADRQTDQAGPAAPAKPAADPAPPKAGQARSEPDATTEPITVLPGAGVPAARATVAAPRSPSPGPAAAVPEATPPPPGGLLARLSTLRSRPAPSERTSAAAEVPLTARAARRRLRAARRARKQYERSEVRRFTSRSRHRRNLWIASGGTVVALVAFVLVGVFSPLMALNTIEVTGTSRIPAADVVQALDGQLGTPLPLIDFAEVKQELSEFSLIRSYVTESRPPDTLVVRIIEREPVGTIVSARGYDLVDAAGVVISSGAERVAGFPVIDAAGGTSGAGFAAAVAVVGALPEGILGQLDTVKAATKDDVTLALGGGERVVWGNSERAEYKAVVLSALLVSHPVGSVTEYDVSSPDSAVVR